MEADTQAAFGALRVDEGKLKSHVDEVVRLSVEETLNALLDAEVDQICGERRYERSAQRVDGRAGHYERKLETKAGGVRLRVPKPRRLPFSVDEAAEGYRRDGPVLVVRWATMRCSARKGCCDDDGLAT
jgi:putative transposase